MRNTELAKIAQKQVQGGRSLPFILFWPSKILMHEHLVDNTEIVIAVKSFRMLQHVG